VAIPWREPGTTALIVPASEAEPLRQRHAGDGVVTHVTLVVPFAPASTLPSLLPALEALIASWPAAPFTLRRVGRWPSVVWLDPEPSAPFVAMTRDLVARFPEYEPYEGRHAEVIPHVTIATGDDERVLDEVVSRVEGALPIACAGDEVRLLERSEDLRWHDRRSWRLR
jgi:2'-5' RNA ligase